MTVTVTMICLRMTTISIRTVMMSMKTTTNVTMRSTVEFDMTLTTRTTMTATELVMGKMQLTNSEMYSFSKSMCAMCIPPIASIQLPAKFSFSM